MTPAAKSCPMIQPCTTRNSTLPRLRSAVGLLPPSPTPAHSPHSIPEQGQTPIHVHQGPLLPHVSDKPDASRQPPLKLSATPTGKSPPIIHMCSPRPPSQHPDYARRLEQLPAYRESLHIRYPPVCANCLPTVEDEIEQKNQMARTKALGGWLKASKGKERQRLVSRFARDHERLGFQLAVWRLRGVLWCTTLFCVVAAYAAGRVRLFYVLNPVDLPC